MSSYRNLLQIAELGMDNWHTANTSKNSFSRHIKFKEIREMEKYSTGNEVRKLLVAITRLQIQRRMHI